MITLERALELLGDLIYYQYSAARSDEGDAVKQGAEGIRRILLYRKGLYAGLGDKMPGELKI